MSSTGAAPSDPADTRSPAGSRRGSKTQAENDDAKAPSDLPKLPAPGSRRGSRPNALQVPSEADNLPSAEPTPSPLSPVGKVVRKNASGQAPVAVVHRLHLHEWQEKQAAGEPSDSTHLPAMPMRRRQSLSALMLTDERQRRAPSGDRGLGLLDGTDAQVRALGPQQVVRRNRDATEWFRGARNINNRVRSIEDTEGLLQEARQRRHSKKVAQVEEARKAQEEEWIDPEAAAEAAEKAAEEKEKEEKKKKAEQEAADRAAGKARVIDPAAMWGPKPVVKKVEAPQPRPKMRGRAGSITEGVKVGDGSFLRRMSTRRITIE